MNHSQGLNLLKEILWNILDFFLQKFHCGSFLMLSCEQRRPRPAPGSPPNMQ